MITFNRVHYTETNRDNLLSIFLYINLSGQIEFKIEIKSTLSKWKNLTSRR